MNDFQSTTLPLLWNFLKKVTGARRIYNYCVRMLKRDERRLVKHVIGLVGTVKNVCPDEGEKITKDYRKGFYSAIFEAEKRLEELNKIL